VDRPLPPMKDHCCGSCKWFELYTPLTPTGRWSKDSVGHCRWPEPHVTYPVAITMSVGFRVYQSRSYVQPATAGCPTWEVRS
jgi:hypothetical protein